MARVVVIFAILSLITGAMFWLARQPSTHTDAVTTVPVAASDKSTAPAPDTTPTTTDAQDTTPTGGDAMPPAEAAASSVPPLPSGSDASILQQSTTTSGPARTGLIVEDVQATGTNSISLKGRADPGATVKVSVNGQAVGEVTVGGGGSWSLSVDKGKGESEPKIVLELVAADGKVLDKTNFVFKTLTAPPLSPQDKSLITAQTDTHADTHTDTTKPVTTRKHRRATIRVRHGQSLWRIARRQLGDGDRWREIYEANKDRIGDDPNYVLAGTRLVMPS